MLTLINRFKGKLPTRTLLATIIIIMAMVAMSSGFLPSQTPIAQADANSDVQTFVGRHVGVYTSPQNPINTGNMSGSKMGNGDVRVVVGGPSTAQTLYVSKSDFWTDSGGGYGRSPLNLGGITINIPALNGSSFKSEQDILHAEVRGTFTINGQTVVERSYVAATDNLIVTNLSLSGGNSMSVSVDTWTKLADGGRSALPTSTGIDTNAPNSVWAMRQTWPGAWQSRVAMATRVLQASSSFTTSGTNKATSSFTLTAATPIYIVTAVDGGKNVTDEPGTATSHVKAQTNTGLDALNTAHRNWWQSFWTTAYIDLGGDRVEEFWYGQQYALASTNRAGKIAPGLFGWITTDNPNWNSDYHMNYDVEGPYYGVYASNHPELALPYFDAMNAYIPQGESNASSNGFQGVYFTVGVGPYGTITDGAYHDQKQNAVFGAEPFIDYYYATKDVNWLRNSAYPYLTQVANFWSAYLVLNGNRYEIQNSAVREDNNPFGDLNSMADLALVKYFFNAMIVMSQDLNVDSGKRAQWQDYVNRLSALPTGTYNGQTVYKQAENFADSSFQPGDNPINFYAVFPGAGNVGLSSSTTAKQIAINTITLMNSWGEGNAFMEAYTAAARAGWPAQDLYNRFQSGVNGMGGDFLIYENGGGLETAGASETVNSMLMQSHEDILRVFPEWPTSRNARFVNLRAKGAFLVSSQLTSGTVQYIDVNSQVGGSLTFQNPWASNPGITDNGSNIGYSTNGSSITFSTTAGHTYHIISGGSGGSTATPTFVPPTTSGEAPYGGTRPNLPGTVQAENYDTGGQNVGYSKPTAGTSALAYRSDENAQIETTSDTGGGADVGWTNTNDWYKYMVNVPSAGTYNINVRVASPNTTATYHVEVDGTDVTGTTTVPNTGGWQVYQTLTKTGVSLSAGAHTLRLYVNNGGMNFNWISVSAGGATATPGGNLALNKATTADGTCATGQASAQAVDGNLTTKWCANGDGSHHWIQIDLGSSQSMSQFVIYHASSGGETTDYNTRDFTIQLSTDGTNWTTVVTVTGNTAAQTTHNISATSARFVKMDITVPSINDPNTAARIYEFQVH